MFRCTRSLINVAAGRQEVNRQCAIKFKAHPNIFYNSILHSNFRFAKPIYNDIFQKINTSAV